MERLLAKIKTPPFLTGLDFGLGEAQEHICHNARSRYLSIMTVSRRAGDRTQMKISDLIEGMFDAGIPHADILAAIRVIESVKSDESQAIANRRKKDRDRVASYRKRRGVGQSEWDKIRNLVIARDGFTCSYCGLAAQPPHIDHIVPISEGGATNFRNLVVACRACNSSKSGKLLENWVK